MQLSNWIINLTSRKANKLNVWTSCVRDVVETNKQTDEETYVFFWLFLKAGDKEKKKMHWTQ